VARAAAVGAGMWPRPATPTGGADVANIPRRPDGSWRARYRDLVGKEHARHFARKVDAQLWLDSVTMSVHTGTYVDRSPAQPRRSHR
jgi:hypothetical protein